MLRYILALLLTLITSQAFARADLVPAFSCYSNATGKVCAGKSGTNTAGISGADVVKVNGQPTIVINASGQAITPGSMATLAPWVDDSHPMFSGSLVAAANYATAHGLALHVTQQWIVTANTDLSSVPEIDMIQGCGFNISAGATLTLPANFHAGTDQVFSGAGLANVSLTAGMSYARPEWWGAMPDGTTDSTAALNAAATVAYKTFVPIQLGSGTYVTSGWQVYSYLSIYGTASRGSVIAKKSGTTGPTISFTQDALSYSFNLHWRDFTVKGTGQDTDSTNDGIVLSPYAGLDGCQFDNILIKDCGGWGLKIVPSTWASSYQMVMQQSLFNNITIQTSKNGVLCSGFVGNIQWNSCTFDNMGTTTTYAFKCELTNSIGAQDMTFENCAFQFAQYGFYTDAILNTTFIGCHFEGNTSAHVVFNSGDVKSVVFVNPSFANSPYGILVNSGLGANSKITVVGGFWSAKSSPAASDRFISYNAAYGILTLVGSQQIGNTLTTWTDDPNLRIYGNAFGSDSAMLRVTNMLRLGGISSTATRARNLGGVAGVASGSSSVTVTLPLAEADTSYRVVAVPSWSTTVYAASNVDYATGSFVLHFGTAPSSSGQSVVWFLFR